MNDIKKLSDASYEERIVIFADILGWSATSNDSSKFQKLREVIQRIEKHATNFSAESKKKIATVNGVPPLMVDRHAEIEFSFFSDCFAVSAPQSAVIPSAIFQIVAIAAHGLLREGFLLRGGAAIGDLYHRENIIFGPALVEAVNLEKEASFPRILCSDAVVEALSLLDCQKANIFFDSNEDPTLNLSAIGTSIVADDLMAMIEKKACEVKSSSHKRKWSYMKINLPKMYEHFL